MVRHLIEDSIGSKICRTGDDRAIKALEGRFLGTHRHKIA
jgi:hypothetical protein